MKAKKLLKEIKDLGWEHNVLKLSPGVYKGEATRPNYKLMMAICDSEDEVVLTLNRLVRWHMAAKYLHPGEVITAV